MNRRAMLLTAALVIATTVGCTPVRTMQTPAPQESFSEAMSAAALRAGEYCTATFIGSNMSNDATGAVPVVYFTTRGLNAWELADNATAVTVEVGASNRAELMRGFEIVVTDPGGVSGVRLSFDATTAVSTQWGRLKDEFSSVSFPVVFLRAQSYEWLPGSDWINTTDPDLRDDDDRLPPQSSFPRARLDETAIRRIVSEVNLRDPLEDEGLDGSSTVTGAGSARRAVVTLVVGSDSAWVGYATRVPVPYILRRLSADPTIAVVEVHVSLNGSEACTLVFAHARMAAVDWASYRTNDDPAPTLRVFRLASAYRWTDESAWRALLEEDGLTARDLPRTKP